MSRIGSQGEEPAEINARDTTWSRHGTVIARLVTSALVAVEASVRKMVQCNGDAKQTWHF